MRKEKEVDCTKCIYGFYIMEGCKAIEDDLADSGHTKRRERCADCMSDNSCIDFKIGNKLFKKFLKERKHVLGLSEYILSKPLSERHKYLPHVYAKYPCICMGSKHNMNCEFREDKNVHLGSEYCWKIFGTCPVELQRETTLYQKELKSKIKTKKIIKMLIDIMIKLCIAIILLVYFSTR